MANAVNVRVNSSSLKMGHVQVSSYLIDCCPCLQHFLQTYLEEIRILFFKLNKMKYKSGYRFFFFFFFFFLLFLFEI